MRWQDVTTNQNAMFFLCLLLVLFVLAILGLALLAYVGFGKMLATIRLTDPARLQRGGYVVLSGEVLDVVVAGDPAAPLARRACAYVADALPEDTSLRIVDVSDPAAPKQVGHLRLAEGEQGDVRAYGLAVHASYAYLAVGGAGLRVVDISDPSTPVEVGVLDVPGRADNLAVAGDRVIPGRR